MFPKRSHAPAHGVLIIKDPGNSNGCQFRHSLLTFSRYLRSRFRCAAPGCIQKKKSARLSSTGSFLCGAGHFPTCSLHRFSIIYRLFNAAIRRIHNCKSNSYAHYRKVLPLCQDRHALFFNSICLQSFSRFSLRTASVSSWERTSRFSSIRRINVLNA